MDDCGPDDHAYEIFLPGLGYAQAGATPADACHQSALNYSATHWFLEDLWCDVRKPDGSVITLDIVQQCVPIPAGPTPPASAAAIQCTASSPCTMTLTTEQWDGWTALMMGAACVIAFALGFNGGFQR